MDNLMEPIKNLRTIMALMNGRELSTAEKIMTNKSLNELLKYLEHAKQLEKTVSELQKKLTDEALSRSVLNEEIESLRKELQTSKTKSSKQSQKLS